MALSLCHFGPLSLKLLASADSGKNHFLDTGTVIYYRIGKLSNRSEERRREVRRKEFEMVDKSRIEEVLRSAEIGHLAFNGPDGWPRLTALNYTYDGRILWHGAVAGERFECLKKDPRASFFAVSLQTYLPSHFLSEETPQDHPWLSNPSRCAAMPFH